MDSQLIFLIVVILILISIRLCGIKENFNNCSQYGNNYNQCYNNNCTIMVDLDGNSVCTNK